MNELAYAEYLLHPIVAKHGDDTIIRMIQEHNYPESFPRQVIEVTVENSNFAEDRSLKTTKYMKLIDIEFKEK